MEDSKKIIIFRLLNTYSDKMTLDAYVKVVSSFFNTDYNELLEWSKDQERIIKELCFPKKIEQNEKINEEKEDPVVQAAKKLKTLLPVAIPDETHLGHSGCEMRILQEISAAVIDQIPQQIIDPVVKAQKVEKVGPKTGPKTGPKEIKPLGRKPENLDIKYKKLILSDNNNIPLLKRIEEKSVLHDIYDKCNNLLIKREIINICREDDTILSKALKEEGLKLLAIKVIHQRMKIKWEKEELARIENNG